MRGIQPFHGNALAQKRMLMQKYVANENIETLPYPDYFPDPAPCDFPWFADLKEKESVLLGEDWTQDHPSDQPFSSVFDIKYSRSSPNGLWKCVAADGEQF